MVDALKKPREAVELQIEGVMNNFKASFGKEVGIDLMIQVVEENISERMKKRLKNGLCDSFLYDHDMGTVLEILKEKQAPKKVTSANKKKEVA